eukprot:921245-Rhodomonas_salina.2
MRRSVGRYCRTIVPYWTLRGWCWHVGGSLQPGVHGEIKCQKARLRYRFVRRKWCMAVNCGGKAQ